MDKWIKLNYEGLKKGGTISSADRALGKLLGFVSCHVINKYFRHIIRVVLTSLASSWLLS